MASALRTELPFALRITTKNGHWYVQQNLEVVRDQLDGVRNDNVQTSTEVDDLEARVAALEAGPVGLVVRAAGNIVLSSGTAFVLVTHNLGLANYYTAVVPTGGDCEFRWYVSSKNPNDFRINLAGTATGSHNFDWAVIL